MENDIQCCYPISYYNYNHNNKNELNYQQKKQQRPIVRSFSERHLTPPTSRHSSSSNIIRVDENLKLKKGVWDYNRQSVKIPQKKGLCDYCFLNNNKINSMKTPTRTIENQQVINNEQENCCTCQISPFSSISIRSSMLSGIGNYEV